MFNIVTSGTSVFLVASGLIFTLFMLNVLDLNGKDYIFSVIPVISVSVINVMFSIMSIRREKLAKDKIRVILASLSLVISLLIPIFFGLAFFLPVH